MRLRQWQKEAITKYFLETRKDFTVTATPGAGKTTFALTIAKRLLDEKSIDRIVVVCPTDHLRTQWAEAAKNFNLSLDSKLGNNKKLRTDYHGYVTTYAQVASHPLLHERRTELPNKTFVIFDEIHHAGDGLRWGEAIKDAFSPASRRLTLTGTPFRTSQKEQIPYIAYEEVANLELEEETFSYDDMYNEDKVLDQELAETTNNLLSGGLVSTSDYAYGYGQALQDGVVRPIMFAAYSGIARWMNNAGEMLAAELSSPGTKKQEKLTWKAVLNPEGNWVASVISAANLRITEIRNSGTKDAGCLILASNQETARAYAKVVKKVTGETPALILSDDPSASKKITEYSNGTKRFIVAVRMVSEGVDIPRLCVLVWLTAYQTPLFFAQAVGRVVRARNSKETSTVFLPTVRSLLALAAEMEREREHKIATTDKIILEEDLIDEIKEKEYNESDIHRVLGSEAIFGHILVAGKAIVPQRVPTDNSSSVQEQNLIPMSSSDTWNDTQDYLGLPGLLTPEQEALLLGERELFAQRNQRHTTINHTEEVEKYQKEISELIKQVAHKTSKTIPQIHVDLKTFYPGGTNQEADVKILKQRRDWLLKHII